MHGWQGFGVGRTDPYHRLTAPGVVGPPGAAVPGGRIGNSMQFFGKYPGPLNPGQSRNRRAHALETPARESAASCLRPCERWCWSLARPQRRIGPGGRCVLAGFLPGYRLPRDPLIELIVRRRLKLGIELAGFGARHLPQGRPASRQEARRRGGLAQMAEDLADR